MGFGELIKIIDERLSKLGRSDRDVSMKATGKPDRIRTIRKGHAPKPDTLRGLARELRVPEERLFAAAAAGQTQDARPAIPEDAAGAIDRIARQVALLLLEGRRASNEEIIRCHEEALALARRWYAESENTKGD